MTEDQREKKNKQVKMKCPICGESFTTAYKNKIYCDESCREKKNLMARRVEENKVKQNMAVDSAYYYNPDNNRFYIRSLMQD